MAKALDRNSVWPKLMICYKFALKWTVKLTQEKNVAILLLGAIISPRKLHRMFLEIISLATRQKKLSGYNPLTQLAVHSCDSKCLDSKLTSC